MAASDIVRWTHAGGGNTWADTNWSNDTSGGTDKPADDQRALFDGRSTQESVTGSLDQSGVDLQALIRTEGYTGDIGTSSTSLEVSVSNVTTTSALLSWEALRGSIWINGTIDRAEIHNTGSGAFNLTGGTGTTVIVRAGTVNIAAAAIVTTLIVMGGNVTVGYNATAITTLRVSGGSVLNSRQITTGHVTADGRVDLINTNASTIATTLNINGGRVDDRSLGIITTLNGTAGVYTTRNSPYHTKTITTVNRYGESFHGDYSGPPVTNSNYNSFVPGDLMTL